MLLLVIGCATVEPENWLPFFVVIFYVMSPIPFLISKCNHNLSGMIGIGESNRACQELAIFLTVGIFISSFGLPIVMARHPAPAPAISMTACWYTMGANIIVFLTIAGFFETFVDDEYDGAW